ncbi:exocyst complex component, sec15 subunit [Cyathus striatus]|nr:exocyst complex component, sec15 subunit [Cyathus striatus]
MPPRRRPQFTQESIDQQLQQIHLLDPSSSSENLEQLGAYLRSLQALIDSKDAEIEKICSDNYQDFISSVSTLFTVKSYTDKMKQSIASLDTNVSQLGGNLVEKKRNLLHTRRTAANLDEAIDTLQACLRVLDVVDRVGEMVKQGKYWSALRSLEDIQSMPATSLSHTPFFQHLLSSLPSLRAQIKDAVRASMKQWLLEIRNISTEVGKLAVEAMELRTRRWKSRREKDSILRTSRVGSAVELVTYEKTEFNVLENERIRVDFKPLFECIQIYTALDSLEELQRSYQADRKAQSDLILPNPLPLASLSSLTQEISGFFIVESHVLETTGTFRSQRDVEELWEALVSRLTTAVEQSLRIETNPETFLLAKQSMLSFIMTLEANYSVASLQSFVMVLFQKYATLLETQYGKRFESIVNQDDHIPMQADTDNQLNLILGVVWIEDAEKKEIQSTPAPYYLPWSQTFYLCCEELRTFAQKFYSFVDGVSQQQRSVDDLMSKSLDNLLGQHISESIGKRLAGTSTLTQIAQIITNLEHFQVACGAVEQSITEFRGVIKLNATGSFETTIKKALARIADIISSKLDQFFELSEYQWTPLAREDAPSMYLYELVNWLTTVVDSLQIKESYKNEAYKAALEYIAECLMGFLTGRDVPMMNENAISNILIDVDFLEDELKRIGRSHLASVFMELRLTTSIPLNDSVHEYLNPTNRSTSYGVVRHKRLQALLEKLARFGTTQRDQQARELAEKRRKEADAVGRLYPGEGR